MLAQDSGYRWNYILIKAKILNRSFSGKYLLRILAVNKTRTIAFHPESDGMVERFNKTILDYLSKFVSQNQGDWNKKVPLCMLAYQSTVNETTQFIPAKMTMGRELRLLH